MARILCVAEKPSIAKAVATHLGGQVRGDVRGITWVKNYKFDYDFQRWGRSEVTFTCVAGHILKQDFVQPFNKWGSCQPADLFEARIQTFVDTDRKPIATNIESQARSANILFIWTDCDREGEHIGTEIRDIALKVNPRMDVFRARFSNIERAHIIQAARNPIPLDERQAAAVAARIELDLRLGAAFTRMQTTALQPLIPQSGEQRKVISYGSCQFPTLGFVVDRYHRVRSFVPETFWLIKVMHEKDGILVKFNWKRGHLFDRMAVIIIYERCLLAKTAKVTKMVKKPTKKWKPLPLTTVELQKNGSRFLRMSSQEVMSAAESLYQKGWISYPRTETDQFDKGMDLRALVDKQQQDRRWGDFAQMLMGGGFNQPRNGRNNDKAHPPIHPVNWVSPTSLANDGERKVYEFVVRRFLACCSEDAVGESTDVEIHYGGEIFAAHGLTVIARNYLDVYPYDKWESSQNLPQYAVGETFEPKQATMTDGKTTAPSYLTEPELIALMDANGIGTDATMAEHIAKIQERAYVIARPKGGEGADSGATRGSGHGRGGARGGRGGRGRGRGAHNGGERSATAGGVQEFIPTTLGVALIEGYDNVGFETSLSKPFLRKEMEIQMKAVCEGRSTRNDVVQQNLEQYRAVFNRTTQQLNVLKAAIRKYHPTANQG